MGILRIHLMIYSQDCSILKEDTDQEYHIFSIYQSHYSCEHTYSKLEFVLDQIIVAMDANFNPVCSLTRFSIGQK